MNFECLKHHYDWNHQLYSRYEIRKTKCGLLFKEMIQMILKDKKKWVMMFVSQIYMVLAMTLIITGLEGFNGYYQKQYNQAINNNLVMIQKKNQEPFKEKEITNGLSTDISNPDPIYPPAHMLGARCEGIG